MRNILLIALAAIGATAPVSARDTVLHLDARDVLDPSYSKGVLDGSVRFYFAGQKIPVGASQFRRARTSRKTNAVGKSDAEACKWVMLTALQALQDQARSLGANAVVGITSANGFSSPTQFECHAGSVMAGVSLRGNYARLAER